jgi:chromosome segregation protein
MDKGAHFYCCELQAHSPRDQKWEGDCPVTPEARRQYANDFVAACRAKGVEAVAITDHHDVAFFPFIRDAAAQERDSAGNLLPEESRIVVFPGIELTMTPHQALLIFDPNTSETALQTALTVLNIEPSLPEAPKTAPTLRFPQELNLNKVQERLQANPATRDRFILLPNVNAGGEDTILRPGHADLYKSMHCVGGYVDGALTDGKKQILDGKDPNYGNKAIGVIQTSDARQRSFEKIGLHPTWIKWSVPSAEAIRQAVLAPASRLRHSPPKVPNRWVRRLTVSDSKFFGGFSVSFNPQANMLIGGRGSGKSTVLEYLRWALADQPVVQLDDAQGELPDYERRRTSLVSTTLKPQSGKVVVDYISDGVLHVVTRDATSGQIMLKVGDSPEQRVNESLVQSLVGIQGYSQKQLSHVSVRKSELVRLLTSPIAHDLGAVRAQIDLECCRSLKTDQACSTKIDQG